jgi:hypothetical protein
MVALIGNWRRPRDPGFRAAGGMAPAAGNEGRPSVRARSQGARSMSSSRIVLTGSPVRRTPRHTTQLSRIRGERSGPWPGRHLETAAVHPPCGNEVWVAHSWLGRNELGSCGGLWGSSTAEVSATLKRVGSRQRSRSDDPASPAVRLPEPSSGSTVTAWTCWMYLGCRPCSG